MAARRLSSTARGTGGGVAYLYVLPCVLEDLLKLGFSRDPLVRMQALHPRFFEFFDLDRGFAVQTESEREARALELHFRKRLREHNAPAPLTALRAAGATEWYRGAYALLDEGANTLLDSGYPVVRPLRPWVRAKLEAQANLLFAWTSLLPSEALESPGQDARATLAQRRVLDILDAYRALDIDLSPWLPEPVLRWHQSVSPD